MRALLSLLLSAAPLSAANVYMLLGNGQSLSIGDYGCNAISTTQSWGNQTWNGSSLVALTETGACLNNTAVWSSSAAFQAYATAWYPCVYNSSTCPSGIQYATLTQSTNQTPGSAPWTAATTQESPLSSLMNNTSVLAGGFSGVAKNFGTGGVPITTWCESSVVTNIENTVSSVKTAVSPNTLILAGMFVTAGESDYNGSSAAYYANSISCQSAVQSAVQSVTGQTLPVPFIYSQMSSMAAASPYGYTCPDGAAENCIDSYPVTSTGSHVPIAQYQLARDSANPAICGASGYPACNTFYLTGPKYHLNYGSNQGYHLSSQGYNMLGAETARFLACFYQAGFSTSNTCQAGVMPLTPIYVSGATVTLNVATPDGLSLDQPSNAAETSGNWSDGVIPVPYYGSSPSLRTNYGFQFFTSNGEIQVTGVSVSGKTITLTLASAPTGNNWQLAYGFEGLHYAPTPTYGCAWNAAQCNNLPSTALNSNEYTAGTPHGNIRTVADFTSLNGDTIYHWMPHFIENVSLQPGPATISGGLCSGCRF